jgi:23S rRNA (uracil1939-C5)-methyltransferase
MPKPRALAAASPPGEWTIDRLVPGGDGFLRLPDGRAAFVTGALPGDLIEPLEVEQRRDYVRAKRFRLIASGPDRVEPPCPVASRCGGCDLMQLPLRTQLDTKAALLREALVRTGRFREPPLFEVESPGPALGYRSRLRVHVDEAGRVGLFARGSHELVEIPGCVVADPEIDRALAALRKASEENPDASAAFGEIEIRLAPAGPRIALRFFPREQLTAAPRSFVRRLGEQFAVSIEGETESERAEQRYPLPNGVELAAPPSAFTQVNWAANLALVSAVLEGAAARAVRSACDLYCGAGNFTLPLARAGVECVGVDRVGAALGAAERAAREQGIRARFVAGRVPAVLERLARERRRFELILLDPPRSGARDALEAVASLDPTWVAMCSCDPVTWARDLRTLADKGYALEEVKAFDLFPQTHHVEALAWMRRAP